MTLHESTPRLDAGFERQDPSKQEVSSQRLWRRSIERIGRALETIALYDADGIETITLPERRRPLDAPAKGDEDGNAK